MNQDGIRDLRHQLRLKIQSSGASGPIDELPDEFEGALSDVPDLTDTALVLREDRGIRLYGYAGDASEFAVVFARSGDGAAAFRLWRVAAFEHGAFDLSANTVTLYAAGQSLTIDYSDRDGPGYQWAARDWAYGLAKRAGLPVT